MSLAFQIRVARTPRIEALGVLVHCIACAGLATGASFLLRQGGFGAAVALSALGSVGVLWSWLRWRRRCPNGRLAVDVEGVVQWQGVGEPVERLMPRRWYVGGQFAWLRVERLDHGGHLDLLVDRAAANENQWHALSAWLVWLERGGRT